MLKRDEPDSAPCCELRKIRYPGIDLGGYGRGIYLDGDALGDLRQSYSGVSSYPSALDLRPLGVQLNPKNYVWLDLIDR